MANLSTSIGTAKTIREYLSGYQNLSSIKITLNSVETQVYQVDVIWDGGQYYIAYSTSASATVADTICILDNVLPIKLTQAAPTT